MSKGNYSLLENNIFNINIGFEKYQKKMLIKSKDFGFIPLVINVKVSIDIPLDEIKIIEL